MGVKFGHGEGVNTMCLYLVRTCLSSKMCHGMSTRTHSHECRDGQPVQPREINHLRFHFECREPPSTQPTVKLSPSRPQYCSSSHLTIFTTHIFQRPPHASPAPQSNRETFPGHSPPQQQQHHRTRLPRVTRAQQPRHGPGGQHVEPGRWRVGWRWRIGVVVREHMGAGSGRACTDQMACSFSTKEEEERSKGKPAPTHTHNCDHSGDRV